MKSPSSVRRLVAIVQALVLLAPGASWAGPGEGTVTAGEAMIVRPDDATTILRQGSHRTVINWDRFSIDLDELVEFQQPDASAIALNRVTGDDPSSILGRLVANGRVFLVNPNGVLFGADARVDVAGLLATTFDIKDRDFMEGRDEFRQEASDLRAVVNRGEIRVTEGGFVFLVAPGVENEGLVIANLGRVVMASGERLVLDFQGDGLVSYAVEGKVLDTVRGPDGQPLGSAVRNAGRVSATGGEVVLSARASNDIFDEVVNNSGLIEAESLVRHGGSIRLEATDPVENTGELGWRRYLDQMENASGTVSNSGTLDVSAAEAGAAPGEVTITGERVRMDGQILARGAAGGRGGDVLIASTARTDVGPAGGIDVSGEGDSDAGSVVVWSDEHTEFMGWVLGQGGDMGGDGGQAEVSGWQSLRMGGRVDLRAAHGETGTLLLDPAILNIAAGTADGSDAPDAAAGTFAHPGADANPNTLQAVDAPSPFTIFESEIEGTLANLSLEAGETITVAAGMAGGLTIPAGFGITFQTTNTAVAGTITINSVVSTSGGGAITIQGSSSGTATGDIVFGAGGGAVTTGGGAILIDTNNGSVTLGGTITASGNLTVNATTGITDIAGTAINVTGNATFNTPGTDIVLGDSAGDLTNFGTLTVVGANVTITEDSATVFTGVNTVTGNLFLTSAGTITDAAATTINITGNARFESPGFDIVLGDSAGDVTNFGTLTVVGANVTITEDSATAFTGVNTVTGNLFLTSAGTITDAAATTINVTGNARFNAPGFNITLGDSAGDVTNFGSLTFTGAIVTITEDSDMLLVGANTATGVATLTSSGSINDGGGVGDTLTAAGLIATAATGIGTAANPLTTTIPNLEATTATGGIFLTNTGALTIGGLSGMVGVSVTAAGGITITTVGGGGITAAENVTAPGSILFTATEVANAPACPDDVIVNAGVTVQSTAGNVTFNAGDDIVVNATAAVIAAGDISLNSGVGDLDGCADLTVNGTLTAGGTITLSSGGDMCIGLLTAAGGVNLTAGGSILDCNGPALNISAGGVSTLQALRGTIGRATDPLEVAIAGRLRVRAGGAVDQVSVAFTGIIEPSDDVEALAVPPGLILFDYRVLGGGNVERFFHATADLDMQAVQEPGFWTGQMTHALRPRDWLLHPDYIEEVQVEDGR